MKIRIIAVGKIKEPFYRDAVSEYVKRLSRFSTIEIVETADEKTKENASYQEAEIIKQKEGERILSEIREREHVIALDLKGKPFDSPELSGRMAELLNQGASTLDFIIGGSIGLSDEVLKRADERWSFSRLTFPHQLMRVILLEQIYRGFKIMNHEPYHK
ncbi:MAG: 23S rRNA (pseudouridine(1915)-N(3))-methyltransferase RlmH [Lachnospiraceae bacterium]|nr:23S rRNA (pseudouridine(1915)-N(3))-methyltransferase RlmH [Lachnospiraceae bacterium]